MAGFQLDGSVTVGDVALFLGLAITAASFWFGAKYTAKATRASQLTGARIDTFSATDRAVTEFGSACQALNKLQQLAPRCLQGEEDALYTAFTLRVAYLDEPFDEEKPLEAAKDPAAFVKETRGRLWQAIGDAKNELNIQANRLGLLVRNDETIESLTKLKGDIKAAFAKVHAAPPDFEAARTRMEESRQQLWERLRLELHEDLADP